MSDTGEPDDTPGASNAGNTGSGGTTNAGGTTGTTGTRPAAGTDGGGTALVHPDRYSWAPYVVGLAVLIGYALLLNAMLDRVEDTPEIDWSRYLYLFTGVEALAFGAAGFFFGREVNRGRAEAAETQAKEQTKRAAKAETRAAEATANGTALSENVRSAFEGAGGGGGTEGGGLESVPREMSTAGFAPMTAVPAQQARALVNLADRLFPRR